MPHNKSQLLTSSDPYSHINKFNYINGTSILKNNEKQCPKIPMIKELKFLRQSRSQLTLTLAPKKATANLPRRADKNELTGRKFQCHWKTSCISLQ